MDRHHAPARTTVTQLETLPAQAEKFLEIPLPEIPSDFADFWRSTYQEARAIPTRLARRKIASPREGFDLYEIEFDSLDDVRIGGWLTVPQKGSIRRGVVGGHGYGGREAAELYPPGPDAVGIYPCARGFHRSAHPVIPGVGGQHVLHGIEKRETYSHRGSAADLWCAANALLELFPEIGGTLDYFGASFGGGIGALAIPWDRRFRKAYLDVPSFGNHPVRLTIPCGGSGEAVRLYHAKNPEVVKVLSYFDAATAASHFEIPVFVSPALVDPVVPPEGQFAVYKAIPSEKDIFVRSAGHPDVPKESVLIYRQLRNWFA